MDFDQSEQAQGPVYIIICEETLCLHNKHNSQLAMPAMY